MGISRNWKSRNCHSEAKGRGICFFYSLTLILACLATPAAAATEELGRLFLTPQQRQDLDSRRATNRAEEEAPAAPQIKEGPLTLDGHVQRSGGKTTTWINGVPQYDSHASRDPARITVVPNLGEPGVSLKIGQTYERASGEVRDGLSGGVITVGKPSPTIKPAKKRGAAAKPSAPAR
ncbi:MAG: hypothetical protein V1796_03285 [Pseudomonadota bacterium]